MGNKNKILQSLNLDIKVPTFFRCPISLDLMSSPVSLSSGVTYDRSSIKPWLDSGKKTCPATNLPLTSTDLIPNLTLRRLIQFWSISAATNLLTDLQSSSEPAPLLARLIEFFRTAENNNFAKNAIAAAAATIISSIFIQTVDRIENLEAATNLLAVILNADCVDEKNKNIAISSLTSDLNASVRALLLILKQSKTSESRADAAAILSAILSSSDSETRIFIAEKYSDLIPELIRLISEEKGDKNLIFAGICCLAEICGDRKAKILMVREGIVGVMVKVLKSEGEMGAEKAMKVLEAVSEIAEGRMEICAVAEDCIAAVIGKILVLMQSNCSPEVRRMAGELLRIFGVNGKSCLAGYDTETKHIMPF